MLPLPPGTILQLMYLNERISKLKPGSFIEVGPGSGEVSNVLLKKGWRGCAYDLEDETILRLQERFKVEINKMGLLTHQRKLTTKDRGIVIFLTNILSQLHL